MGGEDQNPHPYSSEASAASASASPAAPSAGAPQPTPAVLPAAEVPAIHQATAATDAGVKEYEDFAVRQARNAAAIEMIAAETSKQPLLSEAEDFGSLLAEYAGGAPIFTRKIGELQAKYSGIRRVRGDGNCFIRSYIFGFLERMLMQGNKERLAAFVAMLNRRLDDLTALQYDRETVKDFLDDLIDLTERVRSGSLDRGALAERFRDQSLQSSVIFCARLLASCHLQTNAEGFAPFIEDGRSVKQFCLEEVEPLDKDVEQLQIIAMTAAMEVGVQIEYLDLSQGSINHHAFPDHLPAEVFLLYRPGHYDVLYPME